MNVTKFKMKIIENGLSQVEVARRIGLAYQSLYTRLSGRTPFTLEETRQLKKILKMTDYEYLDIFEINK